MNVFETILFARSRQQWYGNTDPEYQGIVHTEIAHVWPGVSHDQLVYSVESFAQVRYVCGIVSSFVVRIPFNT